MPTPLQKLAHGFADNIVTSTALALPTNVKKILAPAMNTKMLEHPATQNNIETLKSYGYQIIPPREALLACGDQGAGALATIEIILTTIQESLT